MKSLTAFGLGVSIVAIFGPVYIMLLAPQYFGLLHLWSIYLGILFLGIFATAMWYESFSND